MSEVELDPDMSEEDMAEFLKIVNANTEMLHTIYLGRPISLPLLAIGQWLAELGATHDECRRMYAAIGEAMNALLYMEEGDSIS